MAQTSPYSYDRMGRLWSEQQYTPANCGGTAYSRSYTYDLGGGVSSATFGLPSTVTAGLGATEGRFRNLKLINVHLSGDAGASVQYADVSATDFTVSAVHGENIQIGAGVHGNLK